MATEPTRPPEASEVEEGVTAAQIQQVVNDLAATELIWLGKSEPGSSGYTQRQARVSVLAQLRDEIADLQSSQQDTGPVDKLVEGLEAEIGRLRRIASYMEGNQDRAPLGSEAAVQYGRRASEGRETADRLTQLLHDYKGGEGSDGQ